MSATISKKLLKALVDTAMGRKPADMVIRDGVWVCVQSGEFVEHTDIAISNGRIAYIGSDASHCIGEATRVIAAYGRYLVPGLLDAHVHVESSMLSVTEFVRAVLPHGTTGLFIDPHEIANVFGMRGVRLMVDEAVRQPIHVWVQAPSCVPSSPEFASSNASLSPQEVADILTWEGVIGLGEVMDFPGVANADEKMLAELSLARRAGKVIGGHYASNDLGIPFHGYLASGAEDDHESTTLEGAIQRVRQGMKVMLRYGSAWQDVAVQVEAILKKGLDAHRFLLCTDDCHAETLVNEGHMDRVLRHAIQQGLPPMTAVQMATINTAGHFGLDKEMGMLAPGRWADVLLVNDLQDFQADLVIAKGVVCAKDGENLVTYQPNNFPGWVKDSVNVNGKTTPQTFKITVPSDLRGQTEFSANVIGIIENQAPNRHLKIKIRANSDEVKVDLKSNLAKAAMLERHQGGDLVQMGLVHGFGFDQPAAVATTVSHDSHQLLVVGTDDDCMAVAVRALQACGGGQVVVKDGQVIGLVELPVAGLMSTQPAAIVASKAGTILDGFKTCGCKLNNPNMQLSLLALEVIPELRLSERGLVDVEHGRVVPLLEKVGD